MHPTKLILIEETNKIQVLYNNTALIVEGTSGRETKDVEYDSNRGCCVLIIMLLFFLLFSIGLINVQVTVGEAYASVYIPILLIPLCIALKWSGCS